MSETYNYDKAVIIIKTAILLSQCDAAQTANEKQLALYYGIGKYFLKFQKGLLGKRCY